MYKGAVSSSFSSKALFAVCNFDRFLEDKMTLIMFRNSFMYLPDIFYVLRIYGVALVFGSRVLILNTSNY